MCAIMCHVFEFVKETITNVSDCNDDYVKYIANQRDANCPTCVGGDENMIRQEIVYSMLLIKYYLRNTDNFIILSAMERVLGINIEITY